MFYYDGTCELNGSTDQSSVGRVLSPLLLHAGVVIDEDGAFDHVLDLLLVAEHGHVACPGGGVTQPPLAGVPGMKQPEVTVLMGHAQPIGLEKGGGVGGGAFSGHVLDLRGFCMCEQTHPQYLDSMR